MVHVLQNCVTGIHVTLCGYLSLVVTLRNQEADLAIHQTEVDIGLLAVKYECGGKIYFNVNNSKKMWKALTDLIS